MKEVLLDPTPKDIRDAGSQFDKDNGVLEEALGDLFRTYRDNTQPAQVFLKVTALNALYSTQIPLYSTRIPTTRDVANHIVDIKVDSRIAQGDPQVVYDISKVDVPGKERRYYYSFATKFCSWHAQDSYPIFDSRVLAYLGHLRRNGRLGKFGQIDPWIYSKFKGIVMEFCEKNGLGEFNFKKIDKFLYLQGGILIDGNERKKRELKEEEPILAPALEQAGEMEWSVENYGSPEEAELSRKKFTDPGGWSVVNAKGE
ncbi:MAG: hypothetical protein WCE75_01035 [Terracidiphilus sp.]